MRSAKQFLFGSLGTALAISGLTALAPGAAHADVGTPIATFPYAQNWSDAGLITVNDSWSGVTGVAGYLGQDITTATGADPQTLLGESAAANDLDVVANASATATNGGVVEVEGDTIAIQGSGTADAPSVVFHLDLTGKSSTIFAFAARDLDASADDAIQQLAVQYRVGSTGTYTNLPAGYVADATVASTATKVTPVSVMLPAAVDNQNDVYVRVMTTNAAGSDELVGIDDISISQSGVPAELSATDPGDKTFPKDTAITPITLDAVGGEPDYTWETTALPTGLTLEGNQIVGTPTAAGTTVVTATVTDAAEATAQTEFSITVTDPSAITPIADIQGSSTASPIANTTVSTEGVVTAAYPTGGFNGFYIQTPGADTTPGRSDAVFVYTGANTATLMAGLEIGESVRVSGMVKEFGTAPNTLTEVDVAAGTVTEIADLGDVVPNPVLPGSDCALPGTACLDQVGLDAAREEFEGEAFAPAGEVTVTDAYDGSAYNPPNTTSSSNFGEIGLALDSAEPLITPTDIIDAQATADIAARTRWNNAHRMVLDDGSSTTYWNQNNNAAGKDLPLPWLTQDHQVRVGAAVSFDQPVILDYRFGWKLQPAAQVVGVPTGKVTFEQDRPAAPAPVGGDIKLATFNVLNYFTTLGKDVAGCTSYVDRAGTPIAVNSCPGNGPRGAWDQASFQRQQDKIVNAINTIAADVVSVEEIENSRVVDGHDRDEALAALVAALNADAGAGTWDYVRSPASASTPENVAEQDVIRTGFIYKPAKVGVVGDAEMLFGSAAFANAREPFAAVFQPVGGKATSRFAVIVNHFKSKGSGANDGTGQGNANPDRIAQATALASFASTFSTARGVDSVFLTGDFNSYSQEDPMQVLYGAGFTQMEAAGKHSYSFDGQSGSLDHVLANTGAKATVSGVDIWEINANESVFNQYSRYNYVGTDLYDDGPFSASDHNPEVIGIKVAKADPPTTPQPVQLTTKLRPKKVVVDRTRANLKVTVLDAAGKPVTGQVLVKVTGQEAKVLTVVNGKVKLKLKKFSSVGKKKVTVTYLGSATQLPATVVLKIRVVRR